MRERKGEGEDEWEEERGERREEEKMTGLRKRGFFGPCLFFHTLTKADIFFLLSLCFVLPDLSLYFIISK